MQTRQLSQIIYLLSLLLILPGWRNYQASSKAYQYSSTEATIPVNSAIVLDEKGKHACRIDLAEYPDLVPNFAQLSTRKIDDQTNQLQRESIPITEELDLPSCTNKYLNQLKKIATDNIIVNDDLSHIYKTNLKKNVVIGLAACALGASGYYIQNYLWPEPYKRENFITDQNGKTYPLPPPAPITELPLLTPGGMAATMPIGGGIGISIGIHALIKDLIKDLNNSAISSSEKKEIMTKLANLRKHLSSWTAVASAATCYFITDVGRVLYIEYNSW